MSHTSGTSALHTCHVSAEGRDSGLSIQWRMKHHYMPFAHRYGHVCVCGNSNLSLHLLFASLCFSLHYFSCSKAFLQSQMGFISTASKVFPNVRAPMLCFVYTPNLPLSAWKELMPVWPDVSSVPVQFSFVCWENKWRIEYMLKEPPSERICREKMALDGYRFLLFTALKITFVLLFPAQ